MREWAVALFVVALLVGAIALPVGAGSSELLSADVLYNDYPDDPEEPDQHLVVLIDEASGVSEFRWNAEIAGLEIEGAWIEGEVGCVSFLGKAAVVGVQYVDIGDPLPEELLDTWWLIEFIDGGPGMGGDLLVSTESTETGVFEACAAEEHLEYGDGVWENYPIGGNIYVAATASSQVETINVNYQIPRDTDLVLDPGMLDWGCEDGYYRLESGYLKVKMQTKDQGETIRIRQSADMDGVLQRYDVSEVCNSDEDCWTEYTATGEFFDLDQNKHKVDLLVDQYTGQPISGTIYAWTDIIDDSGNVIDFAHIDGEFVDGVFAGVWDDTCGF